MAIPLLQKGDGVALQQCSALPSASKYRKAIERFAAAGLQKRSSYCERTLT